MLKTKSTVHSTTKTQHISFRFREASLKVVALQTQDTSQIINVSHWVLRLQTYNQRLSTMVWTALSVLHLFLFLLAFYFIFIPDMRYSMKRVDLITFINGLKMFLQNSGPPTYTHLSLCTEFLSLLCLENILDFPTAPFTPHQHFSLGRLRVHWTQLVQRL